MPRFFLLDKNERVVHKFDAVDVPAARVVLAQKCLQDAATYVLAARLRRGTYVAPPPTPTVDDQPD